MSCSQYYPSHFSQEDLVKRIILDKCPADNLEYLRDHYITLSIIVLFDSYQTKLLPQQADQKYVNTKQDEHVGKAISPGIHQIILDVFCGPGFNYFFSTFFFFLFTGQNPDC